MQHYVASQEIVYDEFVAQRRFHYEQAFEHYLRANRVPYVAVDEAKKSLLPVGEALKSIKSFDFVVYGPDRNLLLDVKGRKYSGRSGRRLENWVTNDDIQGLSRWAELFGKGFVPTFVFVYWCEKQPRDALFEELFEYNSRWYALREALLTDYIREMQVRSPKWGTVSVPTKAFDSISKPFSIRVSSEVPPIHACDKHEAPISL